MIETIIIIAGIIIGYKISIAILKHLFKKITK